MSCAAWIIRASACRSLPGSAWRSAVSSTGANLELSFPSAARSRTRSPPAEPSAAAREDTVMAPSKKSSGFMKASDRASAARLGERPLDARERLRGHPGEDELDSVEERLVGIARPEPQLARRLGGVE